MKRKQLLVLAALAAALQVSVAQATFPSAGDDDFNLPAIETYADRMAGIGQADVAAAHSVYPSAGEETYALPVGETYAERMARNTSGAEVWGVSRRGVIPHDPFPFGGGPVDD